MIIILYAQFEEFDNDKFHFYLHKLPVALREKIIRFRRWQDRQASLIGKLLLIEGLRYFGEDESILKDIKYTTYNRPYINAEIDFNIAHSENVAVCAIAKKIKIGIDIEKELHRNLSPFTAHFSEEEWSNIEKSDNSYKEFYRLWTQKEAIVKADGKGLNISFKEIIVEKEKGFMGSECWHLKELSIVPGFQAYLATNIDAEEIIANQIFF